MLIAKTKSGQLVDKAPASGIILLGDATNEEVQGMMASIIGLGLPDDKVHTLFFKNEGIGVVKIEPCAAIEKRGQKSSQFVTDIEKIVQSMHIRGTYVCLWANYNTVCAIDEERTKVWFRSEPWGSKSDPNPQLNVTIEYRKADNQMEPIDLIKIRLISSR